jgi:hypothetical protein
MVTASLLMGAALPDANELPAVVALSVLAWLSLLHVGLVVSVENSNPNPTLAVLPPLQPTKTVDA